MSYAHLPLLIDLRTKIEKNNNKTKFFLSWKEKNALMKRRFNEGFFMRYLTAFVLALAIGGMTYLAYSNFPEVKGLANSILFTGEFQTLEVRHSADTLMQKYKGVLLKDKDHIFLEPKLEFYPYLLMDVKFDRPNNRTGEGKILWSLVDGEMVIDAKSWEKTHGFTDCINASTSKNEFKIINALAKRGGRLDRDILSKVLNLEGGVLSLLLDSCKRKSLVVQNGNTYRLHLQEPNLNVIPETKISEHLVTKPYKDADRKASLFGKAQIENVAKSAFGNNFAIRKTSEIFLPVYTITVQNPDGSQMTTYWNALNGKQIH